MILGNNCQDLLSGKGLDRRPSIPRDAKHPNLQTNSRDPGSLPSCLQLGGRKFKCCIHSYEHLLSTYSEPFSTLGVGNIRMNKTEYLSLFLRSLTLGGRVVYQMNGPSSLSYLQKYALQWDCEFLLLKTWSISVHCDFEFGHVTLANGLLANVRHLRLEKGSALFCFHCCAFPATVIILEDK